VAKNKSKPTNKNSDNSFIVQIRRGSAVEWPDLWAEVYIAAESAVEERLISEMMMVGGKCRKASTPDEADLVIFGGGADVQPHLYGEHQHSKTFCDPKRDAQDFELWNYCYDKGIPMMGICRGAQMGHVALGGKLYQHVNNHNSSHGMWLNDENRIIPNISSVHHQMVQKRPGMQILGVAQGRSSERYTSPTVRETGTSADIEAFFYRRACFFGVQGHPEYRDFTQFRYWTLLRIQELLVENPDLHLVDGVRRLKQDVIDQRPKLKRITGKETA
jgi:gamma-glutamyl-gamma-aminobutyrate hydrolase PuuD